MATITAAMQQQNNEALFGGVPGSREAKQTHDKGVQWSQQRYKEKMREIRALGKDEPVTILNMNPFPLTINGGVLFPEDVPACPPGKPYSVYVLRHVRWDHKDLGCDAQNVMQFEPMPNIPVRLAAEYIREYGQPYDGPQDSATGFGGVLVYVGDRDPATFKKGDKIKVPEISYEGDNVVMDVRDRDFHEAFEMLRRRRNSSILKRLQSANAWYENDSQRMNVNDTHRDMARLAFDEGLIPELPRWVMQANMLMQKQPDPCPSCTAIPKVGSILCTNCNHIFDPLQAFKNTRIAYTAVEMERLTAEEWKEAHRIHAERQKAKGLKATS